MATPDGTLAYFKRMADKKFPEHAIREFGKTGLRVSSLGFGGYRIHHNSIEHAKALRHALLNGVNLIDTSSNYGDGGSEMLIGNVLREMFERDELERDEVVVVSKAGYVQGQNMQIARQLEEDGRPFSELVKYQENCWHCLHPDFLEDQLSRTLERLNLPALDVYLLHNPEYFLADRKKNNGRDVNSAHEEYYRRIKQAFAWLEEKVAEAKIRTYGISSNSLPAAADDFEFTSLQRILSTAQEVSSSNFFQVVQFPFNLMETGACTEENQDGGARTLLQVAQEAGLATLVNRPLNAMFNGEIIRLATFRETEAKAVIDLFHNKLTTVQRLEKQFRDDFLQQMPEQAHDTLGKIFSLGRQFADALAFFQSWEHWDHVRQNTLMPQSFSALSYVTQTGSRIEGLSYWSEKYSEAMMQFLEAISMKYENDAQERSFKLSGKLKSLDAEFASAATLSQQALRIMTSIPGVDCVLVGMRRPHYVEDALAAMKADAIKDARDLILDFGA